MAGVGISNSEIKKKLSKVVPMVMVAEMLQKWNFIWYECIFTFNQNNFVFNKI